jgi:uncharacterized protein YacL
MLYQIFQHLHSALRWIVLILIIFAVASALINWLSKHSKNNQKLNIFTLIATHTQFIIGLVLYFISPKVEFSAASMSNRVARFFLVEHLVIMLIAIVLITVGYSKSKKMIPTWKANRTIVIFYLIAFLLIIAGIPWPFMGLGGGWI